MAEISKDIKMITTKDNRVKYPFSEMEVGDSFEVVSGMGASCVNAAMAWVKRKGVGKKFKVAMGEDGKLRCFRIQ